MNLPRSKFESALWRTWETELRKSPELWKRELWRRWLERSLVGLFVGATIAGLVTIWRHAAEVQARWHWPEVELYLHGAAYLAGIFMPVAVFGCFGAGMHTGWLRCAMGLPELRRFAMKSTPQLVGVLACLNAVPAIWVAKWMDASILAAIVAGVLFVLAAALPGLLLASLAVAFTRAKAAVRTNQTTRRGDFNPKELVACLFVVPLFPLLLLPLFGLTDEQWHPWVLAALSILPVDWVVSGFATNLEVGSWSGTREWIKLLPFIVLAPYWWARVKDRLHFDDLIRDEQPTHRAAPATSTTVELEIARHLRHAGDWRKHGIWNWLCRGYSASQLRCLDGVAESLRQQAWIRLGLVMIPLLAVAGAATFGPTGRMVGTLSTGGLALFVMLLPAFAAGAISSSLIPIWAGRLVGSLREVARTAIRFAYRLCWLYIPLQLLYSALIASLLDGLISWWHFAAFTVPVSFLVVPGIPGMRLLALSGWFGSTPRDWANGLLWLAFSLSPFALAIGESPENLWSMFCLLFLGIGLVVRTWYLIGHWAAGR